MIDRYGHQDDAIERFQARKQALFAQSIADLRSVALRIVEQIDAAEMLALRIVGAIDAAGIHRGLPAAGADRKAKTANRKGKRHG